MSHHAASDLELSPGIADAIDVIDETGTNIGFTKVWTATASNGTVIPGFTCLDWTDSTSSNQGDLGFASGGPFTWTEAFSGVACSDRRRFCPLGNSNLRQRDLGYVREGYYRQDQSGTHSCSAAIVHARDGSSIEPVRTSNSQTL